jgi:hypothetical protein
MSILDHAASLLNDQEPPVAKKLILQANRLLTQNNIDIPVNLLNSVAPVSPQDSRLCSAIG